MFFLYSGAQNCMQVTFLFSSLIKLSWTFTEWQIMLWRKLFLSKLREHFSIHQNLSKGTTQLPFRIVTNFFPSKLRCFYFLWCYSYNEKENMPDCSSRIHSVIFSCKAFEWWKMTVKCFVKKKGFFPCERNEKDRIQVVPASSCVAHHDRGLTASVWQTCQLAGMEEVIGMGLGIQRIFKLQPGVSLIERQSQRYKWTWQQN